MKGFVGCRTSHRALGPLLDSMCTPASRRSGLCPTDLGLCVGKGRARNTPTDDDDIPHLRWDNADRGTALS